MNDDLNTGLLNLIGNKAMEKFSTMKQLVSTDDVTNIGYPLVDNLVEIGYDILVNNQTVPTDLLSNALKNGVSKVAEWANTPLKSSKFDDTVRNKNFPANNSGVADNSDQPLKRAFESSVSINKTNSSSTKGSHNSVAVSDFLNSRNYDYDNSVSALTNVSTSIGDNNIINSIVNSFNNFGKYNPASFAGLSNLGNSLQFNPQLITFGGNRYE